MMTGWLEIRAKTAESDHLSTDPPTECCGTDPSLGTTTTVTATTCTASTDDDISIKTDAVTGREHTDCGPASADLCCI